MVKRTMYLKTIEAYIDKPLVKILTGIRRCGKSTLLEMIKEQLLERGIKETNIIHINLDSYKYDIIKEGKDLYNILQDKLSNERYYIFLDEIQEVNEWEKCINSLMIDFDVDIYLTGSNSKLMSSEISTYLTGRYVSIPVYPLTYSEYLDFKKSNNTFNEEKDYFNEYIQYGGFPIISMSNFTLPHAYNVVKDIYNSVVFTDIVKRNKMRKVDLFEKIVMFILENVGITFSASSITKYLKSEDRSIDIETIYNYIGYLKKSYLIYPVYNYDVSGKVVLKKQKKYYLADSTLKFANLGYNPTSLSSILENIVFIELKVRGYEVFIGKLNTKEVDFIAQKNGEKIYIQVCRTLPTTSSREIDNLKEIDDNYPKYVLSNNIFDEGNVDGIKIMYLPNFLLKENW